MKQFDWRTIKAIARKDLSLALQNKNVLVPTIIVPAVILVIIPAIMVSMPRWVSLEEMSYDDIEPFLRMIAAAGLNIDMNDYVQAWIIGSASYMFAPMFLIIPLMTSSILASDSFVGERERHTIEGLLYTPISTRDLFVGKVLTAFIPAMIIEIASFIAYAIVVNAAGYYAMHHIFFPPTFWWALLLWLGPGVSFCGIGITVLISSKTKTFIEAQQWSGILVLPIVLVMVGQLAGLFVLGTGIVFLIGAVFWAVGIVATLYGAKTFHRSELISQV